MAATEDLARDLRPHHGDCFACGPDNPAGLGLQRTMVGDRAVAHFTTTVAHTGAPGLLHGGILSALFDEVLGTVPPQIHRKPCVTGTLTVVYRSPIRIGEELRLEAWSEGVERRKVHVAGTCRVGDRLVAEATGIFIEVPLEHFAQHAAPDTRLRG